MLAAKENHTRMIEEKEEDKVEALEIVEIGRASCRERVFALV